MTVSVVTSATPPTGVARTVNPGRLAFADGLRGLAAFWVVLFHASEGRHVDRVKALVTVVRRHFSEQAGS